MFHLIRNKFVTPMHEALELWLRISTELYSLKRLWLPNIDDIFFSRPCRMRIKSLQLPTKNWFET
jgi:hypothetical protein